MRAFFYALKFGKVKYISYIRIMGYTDKEKQKEYQKKWYLKNKEKVKENSKQYYHANKERYKEHNKKWQIENKEYRNEYKRLWREDGHYSVYLLPKENYVGQTKQIKKRMHDHKGYGRDISDYKILHTFNTREEALAKEKEYHEAGYNG